MKAAGFTFDRSAASFERYRALPHGVPEAIRTAVRKFARNREQMRVLDVGAGTGRIGKAFVEANDFYVAVDASLAMLQEFRKHSEAALLIQADGACLPFGPQSLDVVLLMQVLSGTQDWRGLLDEIRRILRHQGAVVIGHTSHPADGVDERLKRELGAILEGMGIEAHEPKRARKRSLAWLESAATRNIHVTAASWTGERTPREFLVRHRSGARFSGLPPAIQEQAMQKLTVWAEREFGPLDGSQTEEFSFELDMFEF